MAVRVLSLDGGGIYQTVGAMVMAEIEHRTGRGIAECFDLVAGTSAGALVALPTLIPGPDGEPRYQAAQVLERLEQDAQFVFDTSLWQWLRALGGIAGARYDVEGLERTLTELCGDCWLSEMLTPALVPAFDLEADKTHLFRTREARADPAYDYRVRDVVRATTAAPAFFAPALIENAHGESIAAIDGAVTAFSPALWAYLEARALYPWETEVVLVSVGATRRRHNVHYERVSHWGAANWVHPLLELVFDEGAACVHEQIRSLVSVNEGPSAYYRFEAEMDDAEVAPIAEPDSEGMERVKSRGAELISAEARQLDELACRLARSPAH